MSLLEVKDLEVTIGATRILRGISFDLEPGQALGLVGESGCGKSMLGNALMGMLPPTGRVSGGSILFEGRDLATLKPRDMLALRGSDLAMVMQDPFTSLNPVMRVGDQVAEAMVLHQSLSWSEARKKAVQMLDHVGLPDPKHAARKFPHELSGGQRQRVVIAIAFSCQPKVLIADEPTTALDVTLQAQILRLLKDLQRDHNTAVLLISHNIGVIAAACERLAVVYAGQLVETGPTGEALREPKHPYTQALLAALPHRGRERLQALGGQPPEFQTLGAACAFAPRCAHQHARCQQTPDLLPVGPMHEARCWLALPPEE